MRFIFIAIFSLFISFFASGKEEISYFVSSSLGNDLNIGSFNQPIKSITKVQQLIRSLSKEQRQKSIFVNFRKGDYFLDTTFRLKEKDSGTKKALITYQSFNHEEVRFLGGKLINKSFFSPLKDSVMISRIIEKIPKNAIYQCDLKKLGIYDYGEFKQFGFSIAINSAPLELFYDHTPMTTARYPNEGTLPIGVVTDKGAIPFNGDYSSKGGTFHYDYERPDKWKKANDIWLYGVFSEGYTDNNVKVKSIDLAYKTITTLHADMFGFQATNLKDEWGGKMRSYYAYNLIEELDAPNEYFVDRTTGILYFYPPEKNWDKEIAVSIADFPLVSLLETSNVHFKGITFEYTRNMGICIEGGENNLFENCIIRNIGSLGVIFGKGVESPSYPIHEFTGKLVSETIGNIKAYVYSNNDFFNNAGTNSGLNNCQLYNLGSGGVLLSGGNRKTLISGNNYVKNSIIHDYNRRNKTYCPGIGLQGCGNIIEKCYIYNAPQQAISINGNNHLITKNIIEKVTLRSHDNGAIYIGRNPTERGNVISYNLFYKIGKDGQKNCSIHLDDWTSGVEIFGNIFYKGSKLDFGDILINGGNDIHIENNLFISGAYAIWMENPSIRNGLEYTERMQKGELLYKRIYKEIDYTLPIWKKQYPQMAEFTNFEMLPFLKRNSFEDNLILNMPFFISKNGLDSLSFEKFSGNVFRNEKFDMSNSFDLLKEEVNTLGFDNISGFQKIPLSDIGPTNLKKTNNVPVELTLFSN